MPSALTWPARRAKLSHDEIQNIFTQHLSALENVCNGSVKRSNFRGEVQTLIDLWKEIESDASKLIGDYVQEMSPARLLEQSPLNEMAGNDREQLALLVDWLWRERHQIELAKQKILDVLERVTKTMNTVSVKLASCSSQSAQIDDCAVDLAAARIDCNEFCNLLRELPVNQAA